MAQYIVKQGDNLTKISKKYNVTIEAVKRANNLKSDTIQIGQKLTIPNAAKTFINTEIKLSSGKKVIVPKKVLNKPLVIKTKYAPEAFGYSVEINANINVLAVASAGGKLGANYVVYTKGKHAWFPYLYAYAGYSLNTIIQFGLKKKDIMDSFKKLTTKTSILKWLKTNVGVGVGISPFAAVLYNSTDNIIPTNWEKWFTAITASVKLKAGLGFSVGGSIFAGGDDGWEPGLAVDINLVKDRKVWFGGTLDIGAGAGTPAIDIGVNYASYFWLLDDDKVYKPNTWFFYYRWYTFLNFNPTINLTEIYAKIGIKLYEYIKNALSIVPNISDKYNLLSIEDYENHPKRELIDSDFQLAILSKGYDDKFFAQLDNETLGDYELV